MNTTLSIMYIVHTVSKKTFSGKHGDYYKLKLMEYVEINVSVR